MAPTLAELAGVPWPGPTPHSEGCAFVERGISPEGQGLEIPGTSIASNILEGCPTGLDTVLTVSSHNTHVPHEYPSSGKLLWRTLGLRTSQGWVVWDGVNQQGHLRSLGGESSAADAEAETRWGQLEADRQRAVDAGPILTDEDVDALRSRGMQPAKTVAERLAALGYLD